MTIEELKVVISAQNTKFKAVSKDTQTQLAKLKKEVENTKSRMADMRKNMSQNASATAGFSKALNGIKTAAVVAAVTATAQAVKKLTDAYSEAEASQMGLESILSAQGKSTQDAKKWIQEYTKDGLIPLTDAYSAYKNLAAAGYNDDQTRSLMTNLKDSAAFNRQASLSMGEAVKTATEGIKNENSVVVDNAGVTKNLSVIWEEYANSVGKSVSELTAVEKRLATTQGIMRETAFQTGDAAKYANTLAGAQGALKAQTQQLSIAIGSIFAPVLQQIIPYIQRVVEWLTLAAQKVAVFVKTLLGLKDTQQIQKAASPIQTLATGSQVAASGLKKSAKEAKELRKAVMGIDEINILQTSSSSAAASDNGSSGGAGVGGISDIPSGPVVDSLIDPKAMAELDKIKEKALKVRETLQEWSPIIKGVGAAGLAAFGVSKLGKWYNALKGSVGKSPILAKGMGALKKAVSAAGDAFRLSGNPLKGFSAGMKSLWGSFKNFMGGLSPMAKFGVSVAALTGEFVVVKNAMYEYQMGNISLGKALVQIVPTIAAVGTAMYAMLGPVGLAATAIVGVGAAMYGVIQAENEMRAEAMQAEFYDGYGLKISTIADRFQAMSENIQKANQPILDNKAVIEQNSQSIQDASIQIDHLLSGVANGVYTVKDALPKISAEFDTLEKSTKSTLDAIYSNIEYALAGSVGNSLEKLGYAIPEVMQIIGGVVDDTKTKLSELMKEEEALAQQLANSPDPALIMQLSEVKSEIMKLTQEANPELTTFNSSIGDINLQNLDFESPEKFGEALTKMSESAELAKDSIKLANDELIADIETLKKGASDAGTISYLDGVLKGIQEDTISRQGEIDAQMKSTAETITQSFYTKFVGLAEKESPTWWERFLSNFTGVNTQSLVDDRILKVFSGLTEPFKDTFSKYGVDSIEGYTLGMRKEVHSAEAEAKMAAQNTSTAFANMLGIHSPSKVFQGHGEDTIEGLRRGIFEKRPSVVNEVKTLAQKVLESAKQILNQSSMNAVGQTAVAGLQDAFRSMSTNEARQAGNRVKSELHSVFSYNNFNSIGKTAANGLIDAFRNLQLPKIKMPHFEIKYDYSGVQAAEFQQMGLKGRPRVDVNWYAKGGVIERPTIIGAGENGAEAVMPLERNTGWIDTLAGRIEKAMGGSGGDSGTWTFILQRQDGSVEGQFDITAAQRKNRRDGKTVIPLGV